MNSRRRFLQTAFGATAVISLADRVPGVLFGATRCVPRSANEKILVVIEMGGGNDGLNTVVPFGEEAYYQNRFTLAINENAVLKVNDQVGFHPALSGFSQMLEAGQLGFVQGVGYPNPNRSHFESMDLWHTAHRVAESRQLGWLGRSIDEQNGFGVDLPAIHYGEGRQPLALGTRETPIPSIRSLEQFRLDVTPTANSY
ncbi:MAG: hypothetical protein R3C03_17190 [Pirellulaceae bacterium]